MLRSAGSATRCSVPALLVIDDGDCDVGGLRVFGVPDVAGDTYAAPVGMVQRAERLMVVGREISLVSGSGTLADTSPLRLCISMKSGMCFPSVVGPAHVRRDQMRPSNDTRV